MGKSSRSHSEDYKVAAVRLMTEKGLSSADAGRRLGINPNWVQRWKTIFAAGVENVFSGLGKLTPLEEEVERLRSENKRLLMEREIFKKAAVFFAQDQK